jgi:hypothetical protein
MLRREGGLLLVGWGGQLGLLLLGNNRGLVMKGRDGLWLTVLQFYLNHLSRGTIVFINLYV